VKRATGSCDGACRTTRRARSAVARDDNWAFTPLANVLKATGKDGSCSRMPSFRGRDDKRYVISDKASILDACTQMVEERLSFLVVVRPTLSLGNVVIGVATEHKYVCHGARKIGEVGDAKRPRPRSLAVRRPPRGVPKAEFARRDYYDVWYPELSPSAELMALGQAAQKNGDAKDWQQFEKAFRKAMAEAPAARTLDLLAAAERVYGETAPSKLLFTHFQSKTELWADKLRKAATLADRVKMLARLRSADGCLSRSETDAEGGLMLVESHRPLRAVAEKHAIVDELECAMIERLLESEVRRSVEEVSGLTRVTFHIIKTTNTSSE
jgi:uncharacterized protein YeaO (DUF488 family)